MEFRNHTPFPALAFEGIDQHDQTFHVIVLRQTLSFASGKLEYADEQAPLCEEDEFFGEMNQSSVRQESDLCQYKPKCDVIVNATAYAPQGKPSKRFEVRLLVKQPDVPMPLPDAPQGFNPWQGPTHQQLQLWRDQLAQAKNSKMPGATLIDKTLSVTGERYFKRHIWPVRALTTLLSWGTLGIIAPITWRLTKSKVSSAVPMRAEYAFGGQCIVNVSDKAARRIRKKYRLTASQLENHPSAELPADQRAIAHTAFDVNPVGRGFAENWFVSATGLSKIPAPQIAYPDNPPTLGQFLKCLRRKLPDNASVRMHAGLGVRAKGHPERRKLTGTIDANFIKSDAWLPHDFDFAVWNAATVDQQTDLLKGDEIITLHNLCAPNSAMSTSNQQGDTLLTLTLPSNECHVLIRLESGEMFLHPLVIDTVIIEPDSMQLSLVWRTVLAKDDEVPIRVVEARMHSFEERDRLLQEIDEIKAQMSEADQTSSDALPEAAGEMAYV
ncbi:DUF2169 family type VI secretion system accessory protein [Undibacterium sp. Ren11W]|uniref:DUF2169 family type VI secretion system accessory protein n=1 Tax=Undibacterium sp. Ren11W TaxID=3413045 RepID=UPI003BF1826F